MKFLVAADVFEKNPDLRFGVVVARGNDNRRESKEITELLGQRIADVREEFKATKVKEDRRIVCFREAFRIFGINPNKYMSSIEALATRIAKGGQIPSINNAVNLLNPGAVVIGGKAAELGIKFINEIRRYIKKIGLEGNKETPVLLSEFKGNPVTAGGARHIFNIIF